MTDELIKNIVNKLLNKFITKGTLPGEHRQMILLEEEVDELEFDITQSLQKYGERVREGIFTPAELNQLVAYVETRDDDGWYYGNKDYFEKRHQSIKNKLTSLTKGEKGQR